MALGYKPTFYSVPHSGFTTFPINHSSAVCSSELRQVLESLALPSPASNTDGYCTSYVHQGNGTFFPFSTVRTPAYDYQKGMTDSVNNLIDLGSGPEREEQSQRLTVTEHHGPYSSLHAPRHRNRD